MVDQQLRVYTKSLIQCPLISRRHLLHSTDAHTREPPDCPFSDTPEICQRTVSPQNPPVTLLIKDTDKICRLLCDDIQGNLRQIEIRSHSGCRRDSCALPNIPDNDRCQIAGVHVIQTEIISHIHKNLINGIYMNIFTGNIPEINVINLR